MTLFLIVTSIETLKRFSPSLPILMQESSCSDVENIAIGIYT